MSFPIPPTGLPALAGLLDGDLWQRWAAREQVFPLRCFRSAVHYLRLKPRTSCRIAVLRRTPQGAEAASPAVTGFLLHLYPDAPRAEQAWAKVATRKLLLDDPRYRPFLDRSHAVVALPFPNDPELPGLRHFHRDYRLKQSLLEHLADYRPPRWRLVKHRTLRHLLAYKPGRRAVYRVDACLERRDDGGRVLAPIHARVEGQEAYESTSRTLAAIREASSGSPDLALPGRSTRDSARRVTMRDWASGSSLAQLLSTPGKYEALERSGRALASLHGLRVWPEADPGDRIDAVRRQCADLAALLPEQARRIEELGRRLAERMPSLYGVEPAAPVHGDFHPGQVVLGEGPPLVADFDRASGGHPAVDLGSMLTYLEEADEDWTAAEAFLRGYGDVATASAGRDRIALGQAAAAFDRLTVPFRTLAPDWPRLVTSRLDRIERRLMVESS